MRSAGDVQQDGLFDAQDIEMTYPHLNVHIQQ